MNVEEIRSKVEMTRNKTINSKRDKRTCSGRPTQDDVGIKVLIYLTGEKINSPC